MPRIERFLRHLLLLALLLPLLSGIGLARDEAPLKRIGRALLRQYEVPIQSTEPDWARRTGPPIMTFVQLADVHHTKRRDPLLRRALRYVNRLEPDWVVLTGDNITGSTVAHHRQLKSILTHDLEAPFRIIQGDNDSLNFTKVFGTSDFSFTLCNVRFIGLGLDFDARGVGVGFFSGKTIRWLQEDLRAHPEQPTLLFIHEPLAPATFLDAVRLRLILARHRQVRAVVAGHLHEDLQAKRGHILHVTAPAVGPSSNHGLKEYRVYEDGIVIRTYEVTREGSYAPVRKWQRIPFPKDLRAHRSDPTRVTDYRALPARETRYPDWLEWLASRGRKRLEKLLKAASPRSGDR